MWIGYITLKKQSFLEESTRWRTFVSNQRINHSIVLDVCQPDASDHINMCAVGFGHGVNEWLAGNYLCQCAVGGVPCVGGGCMAIDTSGSGH